MTRPFALAVLLAVLSGCQEPQPVPTPAPSATSATLAGLTASVDRLSQSPSGLQVRYALEWTEDVKVAVDPNTLQISASNLWLLKTTELVDLEFRDAAGAVTGTTSHRLFFKDEFNLRAKPKFVLDFTVAVPPNSKTLKTTLGNSGLETSSIPLPREVR